MCRYIFVMLFFITSSGYCDTNALATGYVAKVIRVEGKACRIEKKRCQPLENNMVLSYEDEFKIQNGGYVYVDMLDPDGDRYIRRRLTSLHKGPLYKLKSRQKSQIALKLVLAGASRGFGDCLKLTEITLPAKSNHPYWMNTSLCGPNAEQQFKLRLYVEGADTPIAKTKTVELSTAKLKPGKYRLEYLRGTKVVHQASLTLISFAKYSDKIKNISWNSRSKEPAVYVMTMAHLLEGFNLIAMNNVDGAEFNGQSLDTSLVLLIQKYARAAMTEVD